MQFRFVVVAVGFSSPNIEIVISCVPVRSWSLVAFHSPPFPLKVQFVALRGQKLNRLVVVCVYNMLYYYIFFVVTGSLVGCNVRPQ